MPTTAFAVIFSVGSRTAAIGMTKSGTAPVSTAARLESTLCSAQVMRANGSATLKRPMTSRCPYIRGSVRQRLARDRHDGPEQQHAEEEPRRDEREGLQARIHPDLDEEVAAAPEEAEEDEQDPVEAGRGAGGHRCHVDALNAEVPPAVRCEFGSAERRSAAVGIGAGAVVEHPFVRLRVAGTVTRRASQRPIPSAPLDSSIRR